MKNDLNQIEVISLDHDLDFDHYKSENQITLTMTGWK